MGKGSSTINIIAGDNNDLQGHTSWCAIFLSQERRVMEDGIRTAGLNWIIYFNEKRELIR
jgi:hypothetical protein